MFRKKGGSMLEGPIEGVLEELEVNEDELVGYIVRRAREKLNKDLLYSDVRVVLDLELEYLQEQGIALPPEEMTEGTD